MRVHSNSGDAHLRTRRSNAFRRSSHVDPLEQRLLLSADFQAFGTHESVVSGLDETVNVAHYVTSPTSHIDSATIDWGDGTSTSTGTIDPIVSVSFLGSYGAIVGDHTYAKPGSYTVQTTLVEHESGSPDVTSTVPGTLNVVTPSITATAAPTIVAAQGQAITSQVVALVETNIPSADKTFKVTIDWGDGSTPSTATISSSYGFERGGHGGDEIPVLPAMTDSAITDILFGDGSRQYGGIKDGSRPYVVTGTHTYATVGSYSATVTVDDGAGDTATASTPVTVATSTLVATSPTSLNEVTGLAVSGPLAKVVDIATGATFDASSLTATIDWGDGTAIDTGTVQGGRHESDHGGDQPTYLVFGHHTYATTGDETVTITVSDKSGRTATSTTILHVQSETLTATSTTIAATTGQDSVYQVATGADSPVVHDNRLSATIDWGDGSTPSQGRVISSGDFPFSAASTNTSTPFTVFGKHQYATAGSYQVHVTITSDGGAMASTDSTATVTSFSAFPIPKIATAGTALTNEPLAVIANPDSTASASDFTATIDWGDGSKVDTGTVVAKSFGRGPWADAIDGPRDILLVEGTHTYAAAGTFSAKVTITNSKTSDSTVVTSTVTVDTASLPPVITPVSGTDPVGTTGGGSSGEKLKIVPISIPISQTTTTHPSNTPLVNSHTHKSGVKLVQHVKVAVKTHAHHPHGPLGK